MKTTNRRRADARKRLYDPNPVKTGDKVLYHPIIAGPDDGHTYTIRATGTLDGIPVAWLEGKAGCVADAALSPAPANRGGHI